MSVKKMMKNTSQYVSPSMLNEKLWYLTGRYVPDVCIF